MAINHLAAIIAGNVTKSNIIGIRKAMNAQARRERRLSVSCTAPNMTRDELREIVTALAEKEPLVRGDLHASGVRVLASPRYRKRFTDAQRDVIRTLHGFRLVRFDWIDTYHSTPVYRALGETGDFLFRNVAWQSDGDGPEVVGETIR